MDAQEVDRERLAEALSKLGQDQKARYDRHMALAEDRGIAPNVSYCLAIAGMLGRDMPERVQEVEISEINRREKLRQLDESRKSGTSRQSPEEARIPEAAPGIAPAKSETAETRQARRFDAAIEERTARRAALKQQEKQAAREVTGRGEPPAQSPSSPNGPKGPEGTRFPAGPAKEPGAARFDDAVKARKKAQDYDDRRRRQLEPDAQRRADTERPKDEEGRTQFEVAVKARKAAREGASQREVTDKEPPQRPDRTQPRPFGRGFGR